MLALKTRVHLERRLGVEEKRYTSYAAWYAANVDAIAASRGTLQPPSYLVPATAVDEVVDAAGRVTGAQIIPFPKNKQAA